MCFWGMGIVGESESGIHYTLGRRGTNDVPISFKSATIANVRYHVIRTLEGCCKLTPHPIGVMSTFRVLKRVSTRLTRGVKMSYVNVNKPGSVFSLSAAHVRRRAAP